MALDGIVTANLAYEFNSVLSGERISKIAQPEKDEILLTLKGGSGQHRLLLSANASCPMAYLTDINKPGPMTAPNFCMLLRKHISGGRVVCVTQPGMERVIVFTIDHLDEMGFPASKKLILELMGKHSNIIFCDENDVIIDSIKRISAQVSSVREVLPGRDYFIPSQKGKTDPLGETAEGFRNRVSGKPMTAAKAIYTSYTGFSPLAANEICFRAGTDGDFPVQSLSEEEIFNIGEAFAAVTDDIRNGRFYPNIVSENGVPAEFSSIRLTSYSDQEAAEYQTASGMIETYYREKSESSRIRQKSSDLRHVLTVLLDRSRKKYDLQLKQLKDTEKRDKYRLYGELLHTYGYNIEEGAKSFEAVNYYNGETVTIPLDPDMSPMDNAKRYFEKYGKLKRTYEALTLLTKETKEQTDHLESIYTSLDMAQSEADLAQIREEMALSGYIRKSGGKKKIQSKSRPYHYISSDGLDIYVGKNNLQNDEITFKMAEGNDWWFHAKGIPGSHVIIKTKTGEMPDRAYEEAAALAAYYSKARDSEKVEIDYIQKKHVKKPAGAKPGFVVYYTNYSMAIEPDISAVKPAD